MNKRKINLGTQISKLSLVSSIALLLLSVMIYGNPPTVHGFVPDDPIGNGWHLDAIRIHSAWDYGYSFNHLGAVGFCVIGEPITTDQNGDLNITEKASFAWNADLTDYQPYPSVCYSSHEAAVASVAASTINNGIGVAGIVNAPLYSAWPWGNYPEDDVTYCHTYVQQMLDMFEWGSSFGRMVFTMSFLDTMYELELDDPVLVELQDTVTELYENGTALFFVGIDNVLCPLHPMDVPTALPYARAIGRFDSTGSYVEGGYGDQLFLLAPAGGIPAYMQATGTYGTFGGSSCATPIAAASAVLLWNQFPWATNRQIEDALVWGATDTLDPGWDDRSGYGSLNVERARSYLAECVPSANSFILNWSATDEVIITEETTGSSSSTTSSNLTSLILYISIPLGLSLIIIVLRIKRRQIPA
ncbi:MAG: S8 family peptidase [Candidatus Thorarchaeota archaeon]|nr:S8 family peptidase [Candidatus Thorarchaeota archaeon]